LWAIEPHIGREGGGIRFEEHLVIEPERVYWLDDDEPHVSGIARQVGHVA
jgi:predicted phosphatase